MMESETVERKKGEWKWKLKDRDETEKIKEREWWKKGRLE